MSAAVPSTVASGFDPSGAAARSGPGRRCAVALLFDTATVSAGCGELSGAAFGWAVGVRVGADILEASWVGTPIHIVPLTRTDYDPELHRYWS